MIVNVAEDVRQVGYQEIAFSGGSDTEGLYDPMIETWGKDGLMFLASAFYNLGKIHGVRQERQRKSK